MEQVLILYNDIIDRLVAKEIQKKLSHSNVAAEIIFKANKKSNCFKACDFLILIQSEITSDQDFYQPERLEAENNHTKIMDFTVPSKERSLLLSNQTIPSITPKGSPTARGLMKDTGMGPNTAKDLNPFAATIIKIEDLCKTIRKASGRKTFDQVRFMVVAPSEVFPGSSFVTEAWAYMLEQHNELKELIKENHNGEDILTISKGPVQTKRGTCFSLCLKFKDMITEEPEESLIWDGECTNASFLVRVPADIPAGDSSGELSVYLDGIKVLKLTFTLKIGKSKASSDRINTIETRYEKAFISYASADREEVLARIQGIQKVVPNLKIFMDVLSLRSGQDWERELWNVISQSDIFYLFWSENALRSDWVRKEWQCALNTKGVDFIDPIPLVSPEVVPPPRELSNKHFNDWTLAFVRNNRNVIQYNGDSYEKERPMD